MTFDAELDRMHAACDGVFGVAARFRPVTGGPIDCQVEKTAPSPAFGLGEAQTVAPEIVLRARRHWFGQGRPKRNDIFELLDVGGNVSETLRVLSSATVDDDDDKRFSIPVERAS